MRHFEHVKTYTGDCPLPKRQTAHSAGYDFYLPEETLFYPGFRQTIHTGVKVKMPDDEFLMLAMRSSMGIKHGLRLVNCTAIIDADYYGNKDNDGEIIAVIICEGENPYLMHKGERFLQGVFVKYQLTDDDNPGGKRTGGVGSTEA